MKILIVCSGNHETIAPFITEQVNSIKNLGVEIEYFLIKGKGLYGYFTNLKKFNIKLSNYKPDLIHAHYGFSGLFSNLQRKIPVITTYHGSDINKTIPGIFSKISILLSRTNIFVSYQLSKKAGLNNKSQIIPCGVNTQLFNHKNKTNARKYFGYETNEKLILFSGSFQNKVKNPELAKKAIMLVQGLKLIELKGFSREEVSLLMSAVDLALMTSRSEGSPQFIKEAMSCNLPIVSLNVGDVEELIEGVAGCFISSSKTSELAVKIQKAISIENSNGREKILALYEINYIASKVVNLYKQILLK